MKASLAILAAVGVASAASAQGDRWIMELDQIELSPATPTVWVTLKAAFPSEEFAFAGARLSVHATESGWGLLETIWPGGAGPGTTPGVASGGDVTGITVGQVHFPPPTADPTNPQPVWRGEFTVTDFSVRTIEFSTNTSSFAIYPDSASPATRPGTPIEGEASIRIIPAPAGLALLGIGGLAAVRRR